MPVDKGFGLANLGTMMGIVAGGLLGFVWVSNMPPQPQGIEDLHQGFEEIGLIILFAFLGGGASCYAVLKLSRQRAALATAVLLVFLLIGVALLMTVVPLLLPFVLVTPTLARYLALLGRTS